MLCSKLLIHSHVSENAELFFIFFKKIIIFLKTQLTLEIRCGAKAATVELKY